MTIVLDEALAELVARLRAKFGDAMQAVLHRPDCVELRLGGDDAIVGITIEAAGSFTVVYPKLRVKQDGSEHTSQAKSEHVRVEGVEWIAKQVAQYGAVRPEFYS